MNTNFILNITSNSLFKKFRTKRNFDYLICEANAHMPLKLTKEMQQHFDYIFENNKFPSRFVVKNMSFSLLTPFKNKAKKVKNSSYICQIY